MEKPKFELKSIRYHEGMEGTGVNADIFINGKKCLHVRDNGDGGDYQHIEYKNKDTIKNNTIIFNIKLMDDYIESLKPKLINNTLQLKYDRDMLIDDLLNEHEENKTQKKIDKLCKTSIVFGNKHAYGYANFKKPLSDVNKGLLKQRVHEIKNKYCSSGEMKILNKNLTMLGIIV